MVARYNADLANNLGNLLARVATVVGQEVRRRRSGARARQPARPRSRRGLRRRRPTAWADVPPPIALEATWRLIRETNAHLETNEPWKAEPGPEVDAVLGDALEALRIVAVLASPGHARRTAHEVWRRIGLDGPAGRPAAARRRRRGAATPAGCRSTRARRCSPA